MKQYQSLKYLSNAFLEIGIKINKNFTPDIISAIVVNFFSNEREKTYPSLIRNQNKGLMLMSFVGVGKTLNFVIMKAIQAKLDGIGMKIISVSEIETKFKIHGESFLQELIDYDELLIDDLGSEAKSFKDFGTDRNLVADLIIQRYVRFQRNQCVTHITTNLNVQMLNEHYDSRVMDRLKEMVILKKINEVRESKRL